MVIVNLLQRGPHAGGGRSLCFQRRRHPSDGHPQPRTRQGVAVSRIQASSGVFASYVSRHGHAFIDRALYLPKEWADDPDRLKAAHVPDDAGFATKPQIARRMIARALGAKVPFAFVAADSVYGTGDIETMLRKADKGYVLGVAANHVFRSWGKKQLIGGTAAKIAQNLPKSAWRRLSSGEGTKGPRLHDWAYLQLADLDAAEYNSALTGEWTRGLLIRRNISDGALAFFSTWCPKGTPREKLISVEGHRWAIEDSFETAKNELGLDHNETRSWHGWHRHVSLVMLAFAMMAAIRHHANDVPLKHCHVLRKAVVPDLLVDSGNPSYRDQARTTAHPTRPCHRVVTLATRSPG